MNLVETDFQLPQCLDLADHEVHVWQADLDVLSSRAEPRQLLLSKDEQQRADRFKFDQDRKRYTAGRQFLRTLLSAYLQIDLRAVSFDYSPNGKPSLGSEHNA